MLSGKSALITGSTSGIGRGIAQKLASLNADIVVNGIATDAERTELLAEIDKLGSGQVEFGLADMSDAHSIADMMSEHGPFDIVVNNAGIQHVAPVEEFPTEKWNAIIAINLSSAFHTCHHCVGAMKAKGWGRIINIASAHSLVASPYKSAYVAAKHGLAGLTKTLALETAQDGITVNAISPGYVLTPLVEAQIPDTAKARGISEEAVKRDVMLAGQPTKDFVSVQDIAEMVAFLCTDAGKNITGANLSIDGGWCAQ